MTAGRLTVGAAVMLTAAAALLPGASNAAPALPSSYPAAGELLVTQVAARTAPDRKARVIRVLHQFRRDYRLQIVQALGQTTFADGKTWFRISVPMRPNGTLGWIPGGPVSGQPRKEWTAVPRGRRLPAG